VATHDTHRTAPPRLAVIGGGPVGLALALLVRARAPHWSVSVFDARPAEKDVSADPRTLALSLGSVQLLERLGAWPAAEAAPIRQVHVSQAPPTLSTPLGEPAVEMRADEMGVPLLGAVLGYGALVAPLQRAFLSACAAAASDGGLQARFGTPVGSVATAADRVAAIVAPAGGANEHFDLAVIAEGGVFLQQARKAISHDYRQTAWVGSVTLEGAAPGLAVERFTREGPLALLPLPPQGSPPLHPAAPPSKADASGDPAPSLSRAAIVWCVPTDDDPVAALTDEQRLAVLAHRLPPVAGRVVGISPLKSFALGLNAEAGLVDGRVVRIGNAAQTLHPVAGQGLNLGLRDAYALVDRLVRFERDSDAGVTRALRGLGLTRSGDRWSMIAATDFLARTFTWHAPGLAAARGLGLAALQAAPPLKRAFVRQMMFGRR
jgi:2-octaprenyl-6-methoxyphenol hydroxylase